MVWDSKKWLVSGAEEHVIAPEPHNPVNPKYDLTSQREDPVVSVRTKPHWLAPLRSCRLRRSRSPRRPRAVGTARRGARGAPAVRAVRAVRGALGIRGIRGAHGAHRTTFLYEYKIPGARPPAPPEL